MSTSVSTYMTSMTNKDKRWTNAAVKAFNKFGDTARPANKKVKALHSAINALKDRTEQLQ
jgi:hypothetical protein